MLKRLPLFLVGLLAASVADAQMNMGTPGPQPFDMGSMVLNQGLLQGVMARNQGVRDAAPKKRRAGVPLTYRATAPITEKVKRDYLAKAGKAYGPKTAADLSRLLAQRDFKAEWAKAAAPDGMRPGDLGDSVAEYWAYNWAVANGKNDLDPAQVKALRAVIGPIVARNPAVRRLSDAAKQEIAESLMLDAYVLALGANAAAALNDPVLSEKLRTSTNARFRHSFGIDLTAIRLTPRGIVRS